MKYKKKPDTVDAVLWDGNNVTDVVDLCGNQARFETPKKHTPDAPKFECYVNIGCSKVFVPIGGYIVCKNSMVSNVYSKEYFERLYEPNV